MEKNPLITASAVPDRSRVNRAHRLKKVRTGRKMIVSLISAFAVLFLLMPFSQPAYASTSDDQTAWDNSQVTTYVTIKAPSGGVNYYKYPSAYDASANPVKGTLTGSQQVIGIGKNANGVWYYKFRPNTIANSYFYAVASDFSTDYANSDFQINIKDSLGQNALHYASPTFYKSYQLNGDFFNCGADAVTMASLNARILDSSGNVIQSGTTSVNRTGMNFTLPATSSLSSQLNFNDLTVGASYKLVVSTGFRDNYHPNSSTSVGGYLFNKAVTIPFILKQQQVSVNITASGLRLPTDTMTKGKSYTLKGTITATGANLSQVSAYVYTATDTSYSNPKTGTYENVSTASYSIQGSKLDNNCKFGSLAAGNYVYVLRATAGGVSKTLATKNFTVVDTSTPPTVTISSDCTPAKTMKHNGRIYERYDNNAYWTQAKEVCEEKGGHLVTITYAWEQEEILDLLSGCPYGFYHIGATNGGNVGGAWSWVTGESFSYENWDSAEPTLGSNEFYAAIIGKENGAKSVGEWIDEPDYGSSSSTSFYVVTNGGFICEYENPTISVDRGTGTYSGSYYNQNENTIISFDSDMEIYDSAVIKIYYTPPSGGPSSLLQEAQLGTSTYVYSNPIPGYYTCYVTVTKNNYTMGSNSVYWTVRDTTLPVITEAKIANLTTEGYDVTVTASDNVGVTSVQLGTWNDAIGIDAAKWQTASSPAFPLTMHVSFSEFDSQLNTPYYTNVWVYDAAGNSSVKRAERDNNLVTAMYELDVNGLLDGADAYSTGNFATFTMYINGTAVAENVEDFCQYFSAGTFYELKNIRPFDGKAFAGFSGVTRDGFVSGGRTGSLDAATDIRPNMHTVDTVGFGQSYDPAAISTFNGHSYFLYNVPVTWYDARTISEYIGGHLVTITSEAENNFVKSMIGDSAALWIGATDKDSEGSWQWVTGESFSYSNWVDTQPDNWEGTNEGEEGYCHISGGTGGQWNDNEGSVQYSFICEFDHEVSIMTLPASLHEIKAEAFSGIAAERVVVPDGCQTIATAAFSGCPNLREISVPSACVIADGAVPSNVRIIRR